MNKVSKFEENIPEQSSLVEAVPAHDRGVGTR